MKKKLLLVFAITTVLVIAGLIGNYSIKPCIHDGYKVYPFCGIL